MDRLDTLIPPKIENPNWNSIAFKWISVGNKGTLQSIPNPHSFPLKKLVGIDNQIQTLVKNTEQFINSKPANNVLLTGSRGVGKSSLIKSLLYEYNNLGLRLIEIDKYDLINLPYLLTILNDRKEKFILFCDDLSFENTDYFYKSFKTILDGSLITKNTNVLIYATSNKRHLISECINDNLEIHPKEAVEEKISLSERFGIWLHFYPFDQEKYLQAVANWLQDYNIQFNENIKQEALNWERSRGNRSGRIAYQFVNDWVGKYYLQNKI